MADKAISMFVDLRRWEEAKVFAVSSGGSVDAKELTRRQAEWAEEARKTKGICCGVTRTVITRNKISRT